jgi:hypothetical protein
MFNVLIKNKNNCSELPLVITRLLIMIITQLLMFITQLLMLITQLLIMFITQHLSLNYSHVHHSTS